MKKLLEEMEFLLETGTFVYPTSLLTKIKAALAQQDGQSNFCAQCEAFARELKAVKQALAAQPAQEPVAWITPDGEGFRIRFSPPTNDVPLGWDALYTTPPQRTWVGLTFAEICDAEVVATDGFNNFSEVKFARAIEAKLKEKNT